MSGHAPESAHDDVTGRALAAQWSLEYVEPYAISVDPRALSLLLRSECKRLRAVPLSATGRGAVVAVADPSDERFEALRALAGEQTRFVVISERTLDALLSSRMLAESPAEHAPAPEAEHHAPEQQVAAEQPAAEQLPEAGPALGPAAAATQP